MNREGIKLKKTFKRLSVVTVCIFLLGLILAACSSGGDSGNTDATQDEDNKSGESITLELAYWDEAFNDEIDQAIERFNEEYPNVKVNKTVTPWENYWEKLQTSVTGGSGPDVMWMNGPNFQKYAMNNLISSIDPYIEQEGIDKSNFDDSMIDMYTYEDELYGLPHFMSVTVFFYNKKLFDEAGLDYPDETWTWDDIVENARKLTKETDNGKQYGFLAHTQNQNGYYNFIHQAGGYIINEDGTKSGFDLPETQQGLQFLYDMMYEVEVSPTAEQITETDPVQFMGSGKVAMMPAIDVYASTLYEMLGDDLGVAPLPAGPAGKAAITHGLSFVMNANTDYPDEAFALIKYLTDEELAISLAKSGLGAPTYKGTEEYVLDALPINMQAIVDSMEIGVGYPISIETTKWQKVEEDEIMDFFWGSQTVEEAGEKIADEMNKILEEEKKLSRE